MAQGAPAASSPARRRRLLVRLLLLSLTDARVGLMGMNTLSSALWPWLALAGLGAFHGLNPAMGWLFAVALGLHRRSRGVVVLSLAPIALGHAAAVGMVLLAVILFGT